MRRAWLVLTAPLLLASPAAASPHEAYWQSGLNYYASSTRTIIGVGGGPGYRFHLNDALALQAEGRYLLGVGETYALALGITAHASCPYGWQPATGVQIATLLGQQIRFNGSQRPGFSAGPPLLLQAQVAPLRFASETFNVTLLGLDLGVGFEPDGLAPALSVSFLSIGYRP